MRLVPTLTVGAALAWTAVHRQSPAVRHWRAPHRRSVNGTTLATTSTAAQSPDDDAPVLVLLHGLTASGISFGAHYDRLDQQVVVPDLLGFGASRTAPTTGYDRPTHLASVESTLAQLGVIHRPTMVVGHSMGAVLALHLAARLPRPLGVLALSAPLYDTREEAMAHIGHATPLARLFATGGAAELMCQWMCDHRQAASLVWPLLAPRWPWPIAAAGVQHTWPAYSGSLESLVIDSGYATAIGALDAAGIPVRLVNGSRDGVPVEGRAQELALRYPTLSAATVQGVGHELPISRPQECVDHLVGMLSAVSL
ncbi:MAG: alpha/beta fold hydrolase [Euzebya sp.]